MSHHGGPQFKFTEAVSFVIDCETQEEIDYYWEKLIAGGGEEVQCGWLADKYGLSWQVVPTKFFDEWVKDAAGLQRVMHALMQMKKLILRHSRRRTRGDSGKNRKPETMKKRSILAAMLFGVLISAHAQTDYVKAVEKWRGDEEADLKKETGWLTVAGLFWLKEGVNTVGAGPKFDVRLTDNFKQGKFGAIDFKNGVAALKVESGVEAQSDGKSISTIDLVSDEKGKPMEIRTGSQTFYLIRREERFGIRLKDSQSKARLAFKGQHWFPIDESYKVTARLEALSEPKELVVPNVMGGFFKMKSPGILKFALQGKEYSLEPVGRDDGSLFLIFSDKSNLDETYAAGRFLYADKPVNGEAVLDFNKAQNPPCAFTPFATCPLPPPQNTLDLEIKAGEKRYDH